MHITELTRILQFGDSTLPVGAFSFSNILESAIQQRQVTDSKTLHEFVLTATEQAATSDGIALLHAYKGTQAQDLQWIIQVDKAILHRKFHEEIRLMSTRMGRKLGEIAAFVITGEAVVLHAWLEHIALGTTPGTYPVGLAIIFATLGLPEYATFATHQYGVATMLLSAALRLMKISYLETQKILFAVNTMTEERFRRIAPLSLNDMATFAPVTDILATTHVKANLRLFMN